MSKKEMSVYGWCKRACSYVRHPHDRREVMRELEAHMDDRIDELTSSGMRYMDAVARVEEAMGDPDEVGRLLGQVHTPWLSFMVTAAKWLAVMIAAFALINYGNYAWWKIEPYFGEERYRPEHYTLEERYEEFKTDYEGVDGTVAELKASAPKRVGDYTFRVTEGCLLRWGEMVFTVECGHPVWKALPEGFLRSAVILDADGSRLRGNIYVEGNGAVYSFFTEEDVFDAVPAKLVLSYGGTTVEFPLEVKKP